MQRQLTVFLFLLLCFSSCQQRYGHVKRVKGDKNKSIEKEKPAPNKEEETLAIVPADTLPEALVSPEIAANEPMEEAVVPEARPRNIPDKSESPEELRQLRSLKDLFAEHPDDDPDDEPLSFGEKVLIFSIFFFLLSIFFSLAVIPAVIALYAWVWLFFPLTLIRALLILSIILSLLSFILTFNLGKKWINKKLNREFKWDELSSSFLFVMLIYFIPFVLFSLAIFLNISMVAIIIQFVPTILFIFTALYILYWTWKKS